MEIILRLNIYKDRISSSRRRGAVPLHAFYLNAPQNDRLAYLFDVQEPERPRARPSGDKDAEKDLTEIEKLINRFVAIK